MQKLHSAIIFANTNRGSIITTGRFSQEAEEYAEELKLKDITIELIDAAKLAYWISILFPDGYAPSNLCKAVKTTSDSEFPQTFAKSIFLEPRYRSGLTIGVPVHVERTTSYHAFYVAKFTAFGSLKTAVGTFDHDLADCVWVGGDGRESGFGFPRLHDLDLSSSNLGPKSLSRHLENRNLPGFNPTRQLQKCVIL